MKKETVKTLLSITALAFTGTASILTVALTVRWLAFNHLLVLQVAFSAILISVPFWLIFGALRDSGVFDAIETWYKRKRIKRQAERWYAELATKDQKVRDAHRKAYSNSKNWGN